MNDFMVLNNLDKINSMENTSLLKLIEGEISNLMPIPIKDIDYYQSPSHKQDSRPRWFH